MLFVAIWAFAEATLFFIVADVPISAIGLRHGFRPAARAAAIAALAAGAGGLLVQTWASRAPQQYHDLLLRLPGIGEPLIVRAAADFAAHGFGAMLAGSFAGTPYKLFAYAAAGKPALTFFAASVAARFPRFLGVAWLSSRLGPPLSRRLTRVQLAGLFILFWVLFYTAYFHAMASPD